jgi:hypothetical protein
MSNLADYFSKNRYHGKWQIGDRVYGYWNKILFVGTVGNDTLVSELIGPQVSVHLDLPIAYQGNKLTVITVKPKDLKRLKSFD